jgi:2,3-bisphosphoglycerate-dependent phosphoglycerate mutase
MQLYFIRHGQSENNARWDTSQNEHDRVEDPELTEVGEQQARLVAQFLLTGNPDAVRIPHVRDAQNVSGFGISHLYCSLMVRAVKTGAHIAQALNKPLLAWEELHEHGGIYLADPTTGQRQGRAGKNRAYFNQHYPQLVLPASMPEVGWWNFRPFESELEQRMRGQRFIDALLTHHGGTHDRVAVVSHGGFFVTVLNLLLHIPETHSRWFTLNNCAIARIDFDNAHVITNEPVVVYTNRAEFLPRELVT